ncbi:MAG TPA: arginine decarboxylase, pyruvoyl-dependent [Ignavibacteria bacterium]|mgnify:CR=1 FL=1|uniref:arginine decarboxylase n=1 Tax=hydrocarbon metagenome TaxID=938273 RepID=A0A0W8FYI6_9ZZZZ|nr:arginine decarboxylase, pyruvoyl-dependent [Ignavibacteria bacterium]
MYVPKRIFFTKGVGKHKEYLASFESALRDAQIEKYNLVTVSSIFPTGCKRIPVERGLEELQPGQIVHCVMARNATNEPNRLIASSIGVARPTDKTMYGYLSEHHPYGQTGHAAGDYAEDLAASMLATTLGIDFNPDEAWNEKEQVFKMSQKIVQTFNITQSARGDKHGLWTTVLSAAILLP